MKRWFYAVVGLQLLFIVGEAASYQVKLTAGREVLLKVVPVDPRSLFTGHYAALSYDISTLDASKLPADRATLHDLQRGDTVYVTVQPEKPYARLVSVSRTLPADDGSGNVTLRGTVSWVQLMTAKNAIVWVNYGLERYYIPETKEGEVNRMAGGPGRPVITVAASVDRNGTAMIRRILINGKTLGY